MPPNTGGFTDLGGTLPTMLARLEAPAGRRQLPLQVVDLLRVVIALLIFGNLARVPLWRAGFKEAPLLLNDLLVFAVLLVAGASLAQRRHFILDRPAGWAIGFAALGAISTALAIPRFGLTAFQAVFSLSYLARWLAYFGLYLVVLNCVRRGDVPAVIRALEGTILLFACFGIVQSLFLPGFAQIVSPDTRTLIWDRQGHRLVSTLLDPNFAGGLIVLGIILLSARLVTGGNVSLWKLMILTIALVMTLSRSSILALGAALSVMMLLRGVSKKLVRFGVFLALIAAPFLPLLLGYAESFNKLSVDASALARVVSWLSALRVFADNPIIGVGFNTYGFVQTTYGFDVRGISSFATDGGLLFIGVMTGACGLALFSALLSAVFQRSRRIWRSEAVNAEERAVALAACASVVAIVVHSLFLNSLLYPFLMEPLWVLWGAVAVIAVDVSVSNKEEPPGGVAVKRLLLLNPAGR